MDVDGAGVKPPDVGGKAGATPQLQPDTLKVTQVKFRNELGTTFAEKAIALI